MNRSMWSKVISAFLLIVALFSLCSCGNTTDSLPLKPTDKPDKSNVTASDQSNNGKQPQVDFLDHKSNIQICEHYKMASVKQEDGSYLDELQMVTRTETLYDEDLEVGTYTFDPSGILTQISIVEKNFDGKINQVDSLCWQEWAESFSHSRYKWIRDEQNRGIGYENYSGYSDTEIERMSWSASYYDDCGNLVKEEKYNADNGLRGWYEYSYDSSNHKIYAEEYQLYSRVGDPRYVLNASMNWEYDQNGQCLLYTKNYPDGELCEQEESTYNEKNELVEYRRSGNVGGRLTLLEISQYLYDDNGNISVLTKSEYDSEREMLMPSQIFYSYDEKNREIERSEHAANGTYCVHKYIYDEAGNVLKHILEEPITEDVTRETIKEYTYTADGKIASYVQYDPNGRVVEKDKYEYKHVDDLYKYQKELVASAPNVSDEQLYDKILSS